VPVHGKQAGMQATKIGKKGPEFGAFFLAKLLNF